MNKYIDADEAEKWLKAGCGYVIWDLPRFELIRCKDCIYYEGHNEYCYNNMFAEENGYCHHGKPKEKQ